VRRPGSQFATAERATPSDAATRAALIEATSTLQTWSGLATVGAGYEVPCARGSSTKRPIPPTLDTALVSSNPRAPLWVWADTFVCVETGAEAITGSTRMKSATAQKLVLNAFSTAVMVRSGRTWSDLMVDMAATNAKLRGRLLHLFGQATGSGEADCETALAASGVEAKTALVVLLAGVDATAARAALGDAGGVVAAALGRLAESSLTP
jgi:N-acetylmuramic acid 6-phosphate (MurNAc-6-P) etherase